MDILKECAELAKKHEGLYTLKEDGLVYAYHDLKLELIPETSSKWEVLAKRDECKTFLRDNS